MGERKFTKEEEQKIIVPIAEQLQKIHHKNKTTVVGIQGGQGTGKTTIVQFLEKQLKKKGFKVQSFSLDDFYQSWKERKKLQEKYSHNLFYQISRGLPGTHRVKFLLETLQRAKAGKNFEIPIFDKSKYDGKGEILSKTKKVKGRQDFLILEGWCVGMPAVSSQQLLDICRRNGIDLRKLDPTLQDHKVVLAFVKEYQPVWKLLDYIVMLKADSPEVHKKWRLLQEQKLKEKKGQGMSKQEVHAFVEPFLPFTYVCYNLIKPDVKVLIDEKHNFYRITFA
ncbi:MAG TPA: P-loop NTPase fold protein [Candidatus Nanoarchaeia archaeon]|nr:P-loop NTPase fold protein [Candidatus Nanoarchaeia archaeon]